MSLTALVGEPDAAASRVEAIIASWTGDRNDPAYWLRTPGFEQARRDVVEALRCGASPLVLTGPRGHGKTLLLRSLWQHPPSGFAPIFVPFADVEPEQIAAWILSTTRTHPVHDAANALMRLLVTHERRGARPLLLIDELQAMPSATLSHLLALVAASKVEVELVAAGLESTPLHAVARVLPCAPRWIKIEAPWSRADAALLASRIAASLQIDAAELIAAIDLDEVMRGSDGNPRLVRAALAARLRRLDLFRVNVARVKEPPVEVPPVEYRAIPAPVAAAPEPEPAPVPEPVAIPSPRPAPPPPPPAPAAPPLFVAQTALVAPPPSTPPPVWQAAAPEPRVQSQPRPEPLRIREPEPAPRPRAARSRARRGRRLSVTRAGISLSAVLAACAAIAFAIDRGPALVASTWNTASAAGAQHLDRIGAVGIDPLRRARSVAADQLRWISAVGAERLDRARDWTQREIAAARAAWAASAAAPAVVAAADPRILVRVNSDPWSYVEVDGVAAGATPLTIDLAPGPHEFRAELADGRVLEQVVHVSSDRDRIAFR